MSRANLGDVTLNTRVDGPGSAPWIVLSNSLGADLSMWDPQIEFLTQKFTLLRYDTRGHGQSDAPPGPYSLDEFVSDVVGLMDAFGIERATFMGLSLGAMTGMGLALKHPDRFDCMVLADGRADTPEPFCAMWDDRIAKVEEGGLEAISEATLASWFTEDWRAANPQALAGVRRMIVANDPEGYIACCHALKGLDYLRDLGRVATPTLFVGGAHDMGAPPPVMRAMADATPGATFVEIPGAAHVANINAPEAFNAAISGFLSFDVALTDRIPFRALIDRPKLTLPGGKRIAVWVILNVEEWRIEGPMPRTVLPPPMGQPLLPDVPNWSWHEYGMRAGFWRQWEALTARDIPVTLAINGSVCTSYPRVAGAALEAPVHSMVFTGAAARAGFVVVVARLGAGVPFRVSRPPGFIVHVGQYDPTKDFVRIEANQERREWVILEHNVPPAIVRS